MQIRWSPEAAEDLRKIVEFIQRDNPDAAERVAATIYDGVGALSSFPSRGRPGKRAGTRELVFAPLPFVAIYRVLPEAVEIARIWHGARRPPETA